MRKFFTQGEDSFPTSPIQIIMRDALGPILILDSAPTTAGGQLPSDGDMGQFGTDLYVNLSGITVKFSGVAV